MSTHDGNSEDGAMSLEDLDMLLEQCVRGGWHTPITPECLDPQTVLVLLSDPQEVGADCLQHFADCQRCQWAVYVARRNQETIDSPFLEDLDRPEEPTPENLPPGAGTLPPVTQRRTLSGAAGPLRRSIVAMATIVALLFIAVGVGLRYRQSQSRPALLGDLTGGFVELSGARDGSGRGVGCEVLIGVRGSGYLTFLYLDHTRKLQLPSDATSRASECAVGVRPFSVDVTGDPPGPHWIAAVASYDVFNPLHLRDKLQQLIDELEAKCAFNALTDRLEQALSANPALSHRARVFRLPNDSPDAVPKAPPSSQPETLAQPEASATPGVDDLKPAETDEGEEEILRLYRQGKYPEAAVLARQLVDQRSHRLGPEHADTLDAVAMLGLLFKRQDRYSEAEPLLRRALDGKRRLLGDEHPEALTLANNLAALLMAQGELSESELLYRRTLDDRRRVLGPEHPDTLVSLHNLAMLLRKRGKYSASEVLFRKALETKRRVLGEEHPSTLNSMTGLGAWLHEQGRYSEAELLFRQAMQTRRRIFGDEHAIVAESLNNLAILLETKGAYSAAEALHRQAIGIRERTFGKEHSDTLGSKGNLAGLLRVRGEHSEAESLYREMVEANARKLGDEHLSTLHAKNGLASVLVANGAYSEAEPLARLVLKGRRTSLGLRHPDTLRAADNLAVLLRLTGRNTEAEHLFRRTLETRRRVLGDDHPETLITMNNLARLLYSKDEMSEAEDIWTAAARSFEVSRLRVSSAGLERVTFASRQSPLLWLAACLARNGKPRLAWRYLESNLARGLLDALSTRQTQRLSDEERNRERELAGRLATCDERLSALLGAEDVTDEADAQAGALRDQRDVLQMELMRFRQKLEERHGVVAGRTRSLTDIQTSLPADSALLIWLDIEGNRTAPDCSGEHWACVVKAEADPVWVRLPGSGADGAWTDEDDQRPMRLRNALSDRSLTSVDARTEALALFRQRIEPIEPFLGETRHLIVVPAGWMAGAPIGVLTDKYVISYAPSGTVLAWLAEQEHGGVTRRQTPGRLLALGDPVFAQPAPEAIHTRRQLDQALAQSRGESFAPLPGTRREVQVVARMFGATVPPTVLLGSDASEQKLDELAAAGRLADYPHILLATHGQMNDSAAMQSALILAQDQLPDSLERFLAGKEVFDGRLTAEQIVRTWKLDADLVTLSACETGLGRASGGEGYLGFAQALFVAGARSLVLSLWKADDTAAALLIMRFYENLLGGFDEPRGRHLPGAPMAKVDALHEAKCWLKSLSGKEVRALCDAHDLPLPATLVRGRPGPVGVSGQMSRPLEHPHYWSAFILIGDPG